jgi:carboxylesterase type B
MFLFCRPTPMLALNRPVHALDVPYWLSTTERVPLVGDAATAAPLAFAMGEALRAFAATGVPQSPLGDWPAYDSITRTAMLIDDVSHAEEDPYPLPESLLVGSG